MSLALARRPQASGGALPVPQGDVYATFALPFAAPVQATFQAGRTIAEILDEAIVVGLIRTDWAAHLVVYLGDQEIPRERWRFVRPKAGVLLGVRARPFGGGDDGGGKNPLATILQLAVTAAAFFVGGPAAAGLFTWAGRFAGLVQAAASVATAVVGNMLVRAIAPMPQPTLGDSGVRAYDITGARNVSRPWTPVPVVLGKVRAAPPLAAKTYTETVGDDVYFRMLVTWGVGPVALTDLKIGDTPLSDFSDVEIQHKLTPGEPFPSLFPTTVDEDAINAQLRGDLGWVERTTSSEECDELQVELVFPEGIAFVGDEGPRPQTVTVQARYRRVGTLTWLNFATGVPDDNGESYVWTEQTTRPVRKTLRRAVSPRGKYEVSLFRTTPDRDNESAVRDDTYWTALRSITAKPPVLDDDLALTALRIKASEQLNGVLDTLNGVVTRLAPTWNGAAFTGEAATQNPAALLRWIASGPAAAKPLLADELDDVALGAWSALCTAKGWRCDYWLEQGAGWDEIMTLVASCGRARPLYRDGRLTVVVDDVKPAPVQLFTPRNSWGFRSTLRFPPDTHALRVTFENEAIGGELDEVFVYFPGYTGDTAELIETLSALGKRRRSEAYRFGARAVAETLLRRETYTWNCDVEALVAGKGDRVALAHPAIVVGRQAARVVARVLDSGLVVGLELDETLQQFDGDFYGLRWRNGTSGAVGALQLATVPGVSRTVTLLTPLEEAAAPAIGDLVQFGDLSIETLDVLITDVQPREGLVAEISAQPYAPAVFDEDVKDLPAFDTRVAGASLRRAPSPVVVDVAASLDALAVAFRFERDADRVASVELAWRETPASGARAPFDVVGLVPGETRLATFPAGVEGKIYDLRLTAFGAAGAPRSAPTLVLGFTIAAPPDVPSFEAYPGEDSVRFVWSPVSGRSALDYEIRAGASWAEGRTIARVSSNTVTVKLPASELVDAIFWIKAVTRLGAGESAAARFATTRQAPVIARNLIFEDDFSADDWAGVRHDLDLVGAAPDGVLQLAEIGGVRAARGHYFRDVDLGAAFYARTWAETEIGATAGDSPDWDEATWTWDEALWDWTPGVTPSDDARLDVLIATDTARGDLVEAWRLAANTTGLNGTLASEAVALTSAPCLRGDGRAVSSGARLAWTLAVPETFTLLFDVRPLAAPTGDCLLARFDGAGGAWLELAYEHSGALLVVVDDNGARLEAPAPAWATSEPVTLALVQTAEGRRLFWTSLRRAEAPVTASDSTAPLGAFTKLRLGSARGAALTWASATFRWIDPEAETTWADSVAVLREANCVFGDVELRSTALDAAGFAETAISRGPVGFSAYRPLVPGDYSFRRAALWCRLSSASGVGAAIALAEATLFVDLPDVRDSGEANVGVTSTRVTFARAFTAPPEVVLQQKGGTGVAVSKVTAIDSTGFDVSSFDAADGVTPKAALYSWTALGR